MNSNIRVFLVDDDQLFIFLTKKTINSTNLVNGIMEFSDGEHAIEYLKEIAGNMDLLPDIIFLDLSMPIMDGWSFLKEYMTLEPKIGKKIKVYIFTSSISPHDLERAKQIEAVTDFIVKPLMRDKFIDLLKSSTI